MQSGFFMNHTIENVKNGVVSEETVNTACRRVLEMKYKKGLFQDPFKYCDKSRAERWLKKPEFFKRSEEVAKSSIVLLKNEKNILPLGKNISSIALIGPMADNKRNQLGAWHTAGREETVIPIDEAFRKEFSTSEIRVAKGCDYVGDDKSGFAKAIDVAKASELVVMCMGEQEFESGEAASKTDIRLAPVQRELIREIAKIGKPMVLLLHNGRPIILSEEEQYFDGIVEVWHLGSMAGPAIADVVSGDYNPSGKLTMSFPRNMGQIPIYYNYLNTGRPISKERFTSRYTDSPNTPLYPFGYGLSYTKYEYSPVKLSRDAMKVDGKLVATVKVSNTGSVDGEEVVQMYIRDLVASVSRPVKELKGFKKVFIPAGESVEVSFAIDKSLLSFHNADLQYVVEPGDFKLFIGGNSEDVKEANFRLNK